MEKKETDALLSKEEREEIKKKKSKSTATLKTLQQHHNVGLNDKLDNINHQQQLLNQQQLINSERINTEPVTKQPLQCPLSPQQPNTLLRRRAYSVSADGTVSYLTPLQMGRHELYELVPFTAVFGLQKKENSLSQAFCSYAADLDVMAALETDRSLSELEQVHRRSRANLLLTEEMEIDRDVMSTSLIFAVLVASLSQFLVGFNTGVMNTPADVVFVGHSTAQWSFAVAAFAIGGPFGALVAKDLADTRGRRGALLIDIWTFLLGGIIQSLALDMVSIMIGRFIVGFASGCSSVLVPIYLGEMAPPTLRGMLGTMTQFAMVIGILVSDLMAYPFATIRLWRCMFAITPIIAIMQILLAPLLLESPRWLLHRDSSSRKARYIIRKLRGLRYDSEVETEVAHFLSANKVQSEEDEDHHKADWMTLYKDKSVRMLLISALVLQMSQQFSGINAVFYYSSSFFKGVIDDPLTGTSIVGAVNVAATYVALLLMDSFGRRTLILWSTGGMLISTICIMFALLGILNKDIALIAVNAYVFFFEIGLGPIPWLIVAEMFDAKYVSIAMSAACQLNWACNFIVSFIFPYMVQYLGAFSFLPFTCVLLFTLLFVYYYLPETHGTTPEELQAQMATRHSKDIYHNVNIEQNHYCNPIDMEWRRAMDQMRSDEEDAMKDGRFNYGFQPIQSSTDDFGKSSFGISLDERNVSDHMTNTSNFKANLT